MDLTVNYPSAADLHVTKLACPTVIQGGSPVTFDLAVDGNIGNRTIDLEARRGRRIVWRIRLNRSEIADLKSGSCKIKRTGPWYIPTGDVTIGLSANGYRADGKEIHARVENAGNPGLPVAERRHFNGRPTFFLNGKPCPWQGYSSYDFQPGNVAEFGASGANVMCVPCAAGAHIHGVSGPTWIAPGKYDFGEVDERVCYALQANPDANIFLRVSLSLPPFWAQSHKDDLALIQTDAGRLTWEETGTLAVSIASDAWKRDQDDALRKLIRYCKAQPWAKRLAGIWVTCEVTEEWFAWACNDGFYGDYSKPNQAGFAHWLKERGLSSPSGDSPIPLPEVRKHPGSDIYPDDVNGRAAAAYHQYSSDQTADLIAHFAKVVKEETGGRTLVGAFYAYVIQLAGEPRQAISGQFGLHHLLHNPDVDFLAAPALLNFRELNGYSTYMSATESILAAGKLYCCDNDMFSWLHPILWHVEYDHNDPRGGAISMHRREVAKQAILGVEGQWFSLMASWHHDAGLQKEFASLIKLQAESLKYDRTPMEQVAFVVDDNTFAWTPPETKTLFFSSTYSLYHLGRTGAPLGVWLLSDVDKLPERIKFVVIASSTAADPADIAKLRKLIDKGGRTILVEGAPGLVNPITQHWQTDAPSNLLGLPIRIDDAELPGNLLMTSDNSPVESADYKPRPRARLDGAGVMHYPDGPSAAAERPLANGGRLIWTGAPVLSTPLLRKWLQEAGAHCYAPQEYAVYASKELVSVTSPIAGTVTITWPEQVSVTDLFDGWHAEGQEFPCPFAFGQTRLFRVKRA
jgi:hypothetical protein